MFTIVLGNWKLLVTATGDNNAEISTEAENTVVSVSIHQCTYNLLPGMLASEVSALQGFISTAMNAFVSDLFQSFSVV